MYCIWLHYNIFYEDILLLVDCPVLILGCTTNYSAFQNLTSNIFRFFFSISLIKTLTNTHMVHIFLSLPSRNTAAQ